MLKERSTGMIRSMTIRISKQAWALVLIVREMGVATTVNQCRSLDVRITGFVEYEGQETAHEA